MALTLYDLAGADPARRFSPFCWRARLALAHKGLAAETVPWRFTDRAAIAFSGQDKVPVLVDGGRTVFDSWSIAEHLEAAYPDRPGLFAGGRPLVRFVNAWTDAVLHPLLFPLIVRDILDVLAGEDAAYFRRSREARLGTTLEAAQAARDAALPAFRRGLQPLRITLRAQPFLAGDAPAYADYIVLGAFQWARCVSAYRLLEADDPVHAWRDRMLDLFGGLARAAPGHEV